MCNLCKGLPKPPDGVSPIEHAFIFGMADGVQLGAKGIGPEFCKRHADLLRNAVRARGLDVQPASDTGLVGPDGKRLFKVTH